MRFDGGLFGGALSVAGLAVILAVAACSSTPAGSGPGNDDGGDATVGDAGEAGHPAETGAETGDARVADAAPDAPPDAAAEATADASDGATTDGRPDLTDAPMDSPSDALDAGPCMGVICNGQCLGASDCRTCAGASLLCSSSNTCVTTCSGCGATSDAAMPIECFACDPSGKNPVGTCQPDDPSTYCLNGRYAGQYVDGGNGYRCSCDEGGTSCPGKTQVCAPLGQSTFCLTCGENSTGSLQDAGCQGGGACNVSTHKCQ